MTTEPMPVAEGGSLQARVAEEIRSIMGRKRLTQTEMARRLGRPQSYVSRVYRGDGAITLADLESFASALGVHPSTLLGITPIGVTNSHLTGTPNSQ